ALGLSGGGGTGVCSGFGFSSGFGGGADSAFGLSTGAGAGGAGLSLPFSATAAISSDSACGFRAVRFLIMAAPGPWKKYQPAAMQTRTMPATIATVRSMLVTTC